MEDATNSEIGDKCIGKFGVTPWFGPSNYNVDGRLYALPQMWANVTDACEGSYTTGAGGFVQVYGPFGAGVTEPTGDLLLALTSVNPGSSATIDWGDGTPSEKVSSTFDSTIGYYELSTLGHTYNAWGDYLADLSYTDGSTSRVVGLVFRVIGQALTIDAKDVKRDFHDTSPFEDPPEVDYTLSGTTQTVAPAPGVVTGVHCKAFIRNLIVIDPGTASPGVYSIDCSSPNATSRVYNPISFPAFDDLDNFGHLYIRAPQAITVTTAAPASATLGSSFTVAATGGASGQPVTYSSAGACTSTADGTFTITSGSGTCTVKIDQAGTEPDPNNKKATIYSAAPTVTETVNADKGSQTITVTTAAPSSAVYGSSFTVAATGGSSGNPVSFSSGGACSNSGGMFTMTSGSGSCIVRFDQAGNDNYNPADQVTETVTAEKVAQTIAFTSTKPDPALVGGSYTPTVTGGGSANQVVFSVDPSSSAGACTISAGTVAFTGAGTCVVDANQAGDQNYLAAFQAQQTITVAKTITSNISGSLTVAPGEVVVIAGGSVSGSVAVEDGGALIVQNGKISGQLSASHAALVQVCGSTVSGSVSLASTAGPVVLGDDDSPTACAGNTIRGHVNITDTDGEVTVDGNTISGYLNITGTVAQVAVDGNKISGHASITGNNGGVVFDDNTVNGSLTITGNTGTLEVHGNTVTGRMNVQS